MPPHDRTAEVRAALAGVSDPELDESVVALGFVDSVTVGGDRVAVRFRLPTFWCSAPFAWIMAEDIGAALTGLGWVARADIRLVDHFAADRINEGIATGRGFREAFAGEASDDLTALRATFRRKAFLGRMSSLIEALRSAGTPDADILSLTMADLGRVGPADGLASAVTRYLELRADHGGASQPGDAAFRTAEGAPITPAGLVAFLRDIRMTRRSVEANGQMCRILLEARYGEKMPAVSAGAG